MANRVADAVARTEAKLKELTPDKRRQWESSVTMSYSDLTRFQRVQAHAFASGRLNTEESALLFAIFGGDVPSAVKWSQHSLAERVVAVRVAGELLGVKIHPNPRVGGTYADEMRRRFGVPFDPRRVAPARGFRFGDRVEMDNAAETGFSGIPVGAQGTVGAIAGAGRGMSVSPDPARILIYVDWDNHRPASVWATSLKKLGKTAAPNPYRACPGCGQQNTVSPTSLYQRCARCGAPLTAVRVARNGVRAHNRRR